MNPIHIVFEDDNSLPIPPRRPTKTEGLAPYLDQLYRVESNPALRCQGPRFQIIQFNPSSANLGTRPIWVDADESPSGRALRQWHNACLGGLFPSPYRCTAEVDLVEDLVRDTVTWHEGRQTAVVNSQLLQMGLRDAMGVTDG